jgi:hypothetical protein
MRKYAWLKDPHVTADGMKVWKIMLCTADHGCYLFLYSDPDAVMSSSDLWYESPEEVYECWDEFVDEKRWMELEDPLPYCQHDAFVPVRVKGRNIGKPEWGKFEVLRDGSWSEYKPQ